VARCASIGVGLVALLASSQAHAQGDATTAAATTPPEPAAAPAPAPAPTEDAAPEPERRNAVQLDLGLAVVGLAYERMFGLWYALQIEAHVFGTWFGPTFDRPNLNGFGGQIRPTVFLYRSTADSEPRGIYLAPFFRAERVTGDANDISGHTFGWSAGAWGGYSFVFGKRFNLRLGGGLQYMHYVIDADGARPRIAFKTLFPALDLVAGFLF
jgi:hypothetical protein